MRQEVDREYLDKLNKRMFVDIGSGLIRISEHVVHRYSLKYPSATFEELAEAFKVAEEIDRGVAQQLCGRNTVHPNDSGRYRLHSDRSGVFVHNETTLITFLRFYGFTQQRLAVKWFGQGTCELAANFENDVKPEGPVRVPAYSVQGGVCLPKPHRVTKSLKRLKPYLKQNRWRKRAGRRRRRNNLKVCDIEKKAKC